MPRILALVLVMASITLFPTRALAHCQVPCGIYDDELRFNLLLEHAGTIEKAMGQITSLASDASANINQLVRWTNTKEDHAQEVQEILDAYFFTQRLKPAAEGDTQADADYVTSLRLIHAATLAAMKCKQTTDPANAQALRNAINAYHDHYFKDADHTHE